MGVGGDSNSQEKEDILTIDPLMTAAARAAATSLAAANQVDNLISVDMGSILPVDDSGAKLVPILVNGYQLSTIDFPNNTLTPQAYVTQSVPADFDFTKGAQVIFTFVTLYSNPVVTGGALFDLTLTYGQSKKNLNLKQYTLLGLQSNLEPLLIN